MKKFAVLFFCLLPWFALAQDSENYDDFFKDDTVKETDQTKKDYQEDFFDWLVFSEQASHSPTM